MPQECHKRVSHTIVREECQASVFCKKCFLCNRASPVRLSLFCKNPSSTWIFKKMHSGSRFLSGFFGEGIGESDMNVFFGRLSIMVRQHVLGDRRCFNNKKRHFCQHDGTMGTMRMPKKRRITPACPQVTFQSGKPSENYLGLAVLRETILCSGPDGVKFCQTWLWLWYLARWNWEREREREWENERMREWESERMREWENERMREWELWCQIVKNCWQGLIPGSKLI